MQNNKENKTNQLINKFILDKNESDDSQTISHHVNGLFSTEKSTEVFSVNEPSNLLCITLPYKYLGSIALSGEQRHLVFSGDETSSEIGIADTLNCTYSKIVNNPCLNFSKSNPITGRLIINQDKEEEVIFVDGRNPDRILNISQIPYEYKIDEHTKCKEKIYSLDLDCNAIRLNPFIKFPQLEISKGANGELPNGVYSVSFAYNIDNQKYTDYMCTSTQIQINQDVSGTSSIGIQLSNLDRNFETYQILLSGTVNGKTAHKIIGSFPTSQTYVVVSDWENVEYQEGVSAVDVVTHKQIYNSTGMIMSNAERLLRVDVTRKPDINYQPQAFNIKTYYYVKQVPLKYYKDKGTDIGYFRNENYNFVIRWYWGDGEPTKHAQVAGRRKEDKDRMQAVGKDVFENDLTVRTIETQRNIEYWQAFNTADSLNRIDKETDPNEISAVDEKIIGFGRMGYHESILHYPADEKDTNNEVNVIFGENACTPIRYHRMPDEEKVPRYWTDPETGEKYINILGVKFENIEYPKDKFGNPIPGLTHYEILRSERDMGNATVVARGIVTNMGEYKDDKGNITAYSNFPHNSLKPNSFLSKKQTWRKQGREFDFVPLNKFYRDKFTFYSPHGNYFGRSSLASTYLHVETEEWGTAKGFFEEPHKHPKHKLLSNFALYVSACLGVIEALSLVMGNRKVTVNQSQMPWDVTGIAVGSMNVGTSSTLGSLYPTTSTVHDENRLSFPRFYEDIKNTNPALIPVKFLINTLKLLIALGGFVLEASRFVSEIMETVKNFSQSHQYARQFNSVVLYDNQKKVRKGNKRRAFERQPFYLDNGIHNSGGISINNGGRNGGIYLNTKYPLPFPEKEDTSRFTMSEARLRAKSNQFVESQSSVFYCTLMKHNPNQYGSIDGVSPVKIHTNPIAIDPKEKVYSSPILFGGDCIIYEQTHLNRFPIFRQDLTNTDFEDGIPFDYRLYKNVGYPRFWMDSTEYDIGDMMNAIGKNQPTLAKLPNQKYNLDLQNIKKNEWIEKDQVFYTSVNGVFRYIVEAPYNIAYRSSKDEGELNAFHYSDEQTNLSKIFKSDVKDKPEGYRLDPSYQKLSQNLVASEQITKIPKAPFREKNTVLYSLPATQFHTYNNWRYFLPLNRFTFEERDFGYITGVHALDQDRILFLFSKTSPYILPGQDMLQLDSGRKVVIGDGGLFAVAPKEIIRTHVAYGSNHDKFAFNQNQFGNFYVSEQQGKLFNFKGDLDEFSRKGWQKWTANFIPLQLKKQFTNYRNVHNPIAGVGYQIVFDNFYELVYICKKDYYAKEGVEYDEVSDRFYFGNIKVELGDPQYFIDCSFTLSYSPVYETFGSFHDWVPDGVIQEERHFLTVKNNTIWKHNERLDSFCNFYGKDYPYQIGFNISTGQRTSVLNNIEWIQETRIYKSNERDYFSPFDETFNWAMIYNQEQLSGMLNLIPSTDLREEFRYFPEFINDYQIKVPIKKAEGKWRLNMFYDYTKDRGRLENYDKQPFITHKNGYKFEINKPYLDFSHQRPPRFRNHWHSVWFSREKCGNIQFITKFNNSQLNISPR